MFYQLTVEKNQNHSQEILSMLKNFTTLTNTNLNSDFSTTREDLKFGASVMLLSFSPQESHGVLSRWRCVTMVPMNVAKGKDIVSAPGTCWVAV